MRLAICEGSLLDEATFNTVNAVIVKAKPPKKYRIQNAFHRGWLPLKKLFLWACDIGEAFMSIT